MDQVWQLFARLSLRQKLNLGITVLAVGLGLMALVRWNTEQDFRVLFSSLPAEDAGQITTRLRERGVEYRVSDSGDAISVPSGRLAEIRLELAGQGLPKSGRMGFELFDKTNLATTDFQEQVNYHRALEGELERTIMSIAEVEQARVHLTFAKDSIFQESKQPAKASVMVKLRTGLQLPASSVQAITHLASSAVEGLMPEAVSVVDTRGRVLNRAKRGRGGAGEPDDAQLEYRQKLERDLLAKVNETLEPLLGADHFRAEVSADVDFSSGEQSEETFDPTRSVMASQQRTEDTNGSSQTAGVPGTSSNLPRPTSRPGDSGRNSARRTENITYQTTRTVKRLRLPEGAVKRLSLSVLVDHGLRWEGTGDKAKRIVEPPPPEKLKKISDLVSAAVGLQSQRGDQIIVESIPFESTTNALPPGTDIGSPRGESGVPWPAWLPAPLRSLPIVGGILGGVLLLILVLIGLLMRRGKPRVTASSAGAVTGGRASAETLPAAPDTSGRSVTEQLADQANRKLEAEAKALGELKLPGAQATKSEVLSKHISAEAKKDAAGVATVMRNWLQEDGIAR